MSIADQERDDVLLRRAGKGDEEAFTLLYRRHQAALYRFALRMSGNPWAAEEIVQDVFMTLMRDRGNTTLLAALWAASFTA